MKSNSSRDTIDDTTFIIFMNISICSWFSVYSLNYS